MSRKIRSVKGKVKEYIKFNIIGISNFLLSQLLYLTLYLGFKIYYLISYSITSVISITASYILNSKLTFNENNYSFKKFSLSTLIYIFEYILNMVIIIGLVKFFNMSKVIAPLVAPIFSTPPVFFMMRHVIKKNSKG